MPNADIYCVNPVTQQHVCLWLTYLGSTVYYKNDEDVYYKYGHKEKHSKHHSIAICGMFDHLYKALKKNISCWFTKNQCDLLHRNFGSR